MACLVKYCVAEHTPTLGLCKGHVKVWHKDGEPVGEALDAWLKNQSDLELDVCPTPYELALKICRRLEAEVVKEHYLCDPFRILEPSAGDGPFVRAARATWPNAVITAIEIRPEMRQALLNAGADHVVTAELVPSLESNLMLPAPPPLEHDLVLGNPPFTRAEEHIRELLANMKDEAHLAFLLRVGFYESFERLPFWTTYPEKFFGPIVPRPGFKLNGQGKKGTDSQAYGLFDWQKGWKGVPSRMSHVVWREETRGRGRTRKEKKDESQLTEAPELEV